MTSENVPERAKPTCRAFTRAGAACKSPAVNADGLCAIHAGRLDPAELGRRSAKSRKAKRERRGSFREAVRDVLGREPERHAERLLSAGAAGYKLAHRHPPARPGHVEVTRSVAELLEWCLPGQRPPKGGSE